MQDQSHYLVLILLSEHLKWYIGRPIYTNTHMYI